MPNTLTVYCTDKDKQIQAEAFSSKHGFKLTDSLNTETPLYLSFDHDLPTLYDTDIQSSISVDFTSGALTHRLQFGGGKGQTIAKAIGITSKNKPHILDATAGLGRDSLVLANLGCQLSLTEQSPVLYEMLTQAKLAASDNEIFKLATEKGFSIYHHNAVSFMKDKIINDCDVVYLDPMYPEKKKSALVKKDMQILQKLLGHSTEDEIADLLKAALKFAKQRVVVKRPKGANTIGRLKPTMTLNSKKTRYDIYVIKAINLDSV